MNIEQRIGYFLAGFNRFPRLRRFRKVDIWMLYYYPIRHKGKYYPFK